MHGEVRTNPIRVLVQPGLNMIGTGLPITDSSESGGPKVTLGGVETESVIPSGLEDVLTPGDSTTADTVSVFNGASFDTYYLKDDSVPLGGTGWRTIANPFDDQAGVVLPEAAGVLLRNNGPIRLWTIPSPF